MVADLQNFQLTVKSFTALFTDSNKPTGSVLVLEKGNFLTYSENGPDVMKAQQLLNFGQKSEILGISTVSFEAAHFMPTLITVGSSPSKSHFFNLQQSR